MEIVAKFGFMDKRKLDTILKKYDNPNFIPGIYNFCDRWCERCSFTSRCANYSTSQHEHSKSSNDAENKEFWEELAEIFKTTAQLIIHIAEKEGVDLSNIQVDDKTDYESRRNKAENHELIQIAKKYENTVQEWRHVKENEFQNLFALLPKHSDNQVKLHDTFDVIFWYQHLITSKLYRALGSVISEKEFELEPYDSDGSAKIALISVERSMSAWTFILQSLEKYEDDVLPLLVTLDKLKNKIKSYFPNAEKFIRPGLDE